MKTRFFTILFVSIFHGLLFSSRTNAQYVVNGKEIDTTFNTAMNNIFGNLDKTKIPFGLLRDYAMEFTNLENFNGIALVDSNMVNDGILREIYTTLATSRMTAAAVATLPNPNTIDSLWFLARQPGQVTLCGLYYQYTYLASNADSTGKITVTNNQLFDKYVNGVWQNPYLQGQTLGFAPAATTYNALSFNIMLPANLWLSNSKTLVSAIQIDAGDGLGYRTITPGMPLAVNYTGTGLKTWNFKVLLTNSTILQSHTQITISGTQSTLSCYSAGCGPYIPPGGGGNQDLKSNAITANGTSIPPDIISGYYPSFFFNTGATYNGVSAKGEVTVQFATGHTSITNPLIVVEGFDQGYYTLPETTTGYYTLSDFLFSASKSSSLSALINSNNSQYDIIFIDFINGTDDIHRNALLVESVIRWVNAVKTTNNKDVVLGLSMGGLCARYALKKMEAGGETHNVRLFICHGSPQQGVNVPSGLQDLETHGNSLYIRTGVRGLYSTYRLFKPSKPNYDGILTLSNTPAAQQMLISHINPDFTVNNSVHSAWQSELAALGYPSQGGIRNVAISNGSECGQTQILTQNGQVVYLNGKLNTALLGDVIGMLAGVYDIPTVLSGQPAFLLSVVPGRNAINANFQINAAVDGGGNQAYTGKITYTKTILWFIPVSVTITNRTFAAPAGVYSYETFGGDFFLLPGIGSYSDQNAFGAYKIILNIAPTFGFVTTPSVLDIGKGTTALSESDYLAPYSQASPPASPKNTPFVNFITAYMPTGGNNPVNNNEQHISYEPRNGTWLAAELNSAPLIADCTALCQINAITGDANDCNAVKTYSVPSYSNVKYTWTTSSNLTISGGQGTPSVQIQPISGSNGQQGAITANFYINDNTNNCGTQSVTRNITIGVEPLVVTSTIDRTPQASHYQYLTATATQLANTTASNYTWYLVVNNKPTSQIGTGLTLNKYPIPPCATFYYQCQATTACGVSTYTTYAYNTYCSGSNAVTDQSVLIYPNPADNSMTITNNNIPVVETDAISATGTTPQSYQVILYNVKGKVLRSAKNVNGNKNISFATGDLDNGHYFIHIIQGGNTIEKQVIVQH